MAGGRYTDYVGAYRSAATNALRTSGFDSPFEKDGAVDRAAEVATRARNLIWSNPASPDPTNMTVAYVNNAMNFNGGGVPNFVVEEFKKNVYGSGFNPLAGQGGPSSPYLPNRASPGANSSAGTDGFTNIGLSPNVNVNPVTPTQPDPPDASKSIINPANLKGTIGGGAALQGTLPIGKSGNVVVSGNGNQEL